MTSLALALMFTSLALSGVGYLVRRTLRKDRADVLAAFHAGSAYWWEGLELSDWIRNYRHRDISGQIYITLHALENEGVIESRETPATEARGWRPGREYRLVKREAT